MLLVGVWVGCHWVGLAGWIVVGPGVDTCSVHALRRGAGFKRPFDEYSTLTHRAVLAGAVALRAHWYVMLRVRQAGETRIFVHTPG